MKWEVNSANIKDRDEEAIARVNPVYSRVGANLPAGGTSCKSIDKEGKKMEDG